MVSGPRVQMGRDLDRVTISAEFKALELGTPDRIQLDI